MSVSYGRLQSLLHPPGSRVTQQSSISQFNNVGHNRGACGRDRGHVGRDNGCGRGYGRGIQGWRGVRRHGQTPHKFSSSTENSFQNLVHNLQTNKTALLAIK